MLFNQCKSTIFFHKSFYLGYSLCISSIHFYFKFKPFGVVLIIIAIFVEH